MFNYSKIYNDEFKTINIGAVFEQVMQTPRLKIYSAEGGKKYLVVLDDKITTTLHYRSSLDNDGKLSILSSAIVHMFFATVMNPDVAERIELLKLLGDEGRAYLNQLPTDVRSRYDMNDDFVSENEDIKILSAIYHTDFAMTPLSIEPKEGNYGLSVFPIMGVELIRIGMSYKNGNPSDLQIGDISAKLDMSVRHKLLSDWVVELNLFQETFKRKVEMLGVE